MIDQATLFQIIFLTACGLMGLLGLCGYLGWRLYRCEQQFERMITHLAPSNCEHDERPNCVWKITNPAINEWTGSCGANGEFGGESPAGQLIYCPECGGKLVLQEQDNQS